TPGLGPRVVTPPPRRGGVTRRGAGFELLEPVVAELRKLDQVPVRVLDRGRAEEAGVPGRIDERHAARLETPRERVDVEDRERELHRTDTRTSVRKRLDGVDREVNVAEGTAPVGQRAPVPLVFQGNADDVPIEVGETLRVRRDDENGGEEFDRLSIHGILLHSVAA